MSSKFFNNTSSTLYDKFKGISENMTNFEVFHAVVGYFRSSGYFKLREQLENVEEIKILVGINIDDIFRKHNKAMLMLVDSEKALEVYQEDFINDIRDAKYSPEVEKGILQMCEDLASGKLKMRIHASKNLHAKFYLCLPKNHSVNTDGWVIMGSSNISDSGLGLSTPPRYELNVAMKDYDDVVYCENEFQTLWNESVELTINDIDRIKGKTYLGYQPTPYELYIKVLIDTFGDQVEDDFSFILPDGVKDLKYQKDAVIQGYQMLLKHNGFFLADVVGLGKTIVALMIAKRFYEANGNKTNILIICPPAVEVNWKEWIEKFHFKKSNVQIVHNGSLSKIIEQKANYKSKEEFDLIIVDEAHGFRSDTALKYDELQRICKSTCINGGLLNNTHKKVMLLSATPLNNRPEDLENLLLLFQNSQNCTIDGIPNLKRFFEPINSAYDKLMADRKKTNNNEKITQEVDKLYEIVRNKVLDKITVRRTRTNIINDPDYKIDIEAQGIKFPRILPPKDLTYKLNDNLNKLFYETIDILTNEERKDHITYARYRAIEFLLPQYKKKYKKADSISNNLKGLYRTHMVKRLESSFYAFKQSLRTFLFITEGMLKMFDEDKIIIAPELKVKELQTKGMELDEILEYAIEKGYIDDAAEITYRADCFESGFLSMLQNDKKILEQLISNWSKIDYDPKYDLFIDKLNNEFLKKRINKEGKLVIFSESVDTIKFLNDKLTNTLGKKDVLMVTASNREKQLSNIKNNFDANNEIKKDDFNIILTSDVLAEGVNLHRSNVIINYDSPWNATRLMQRNGRVNRIGSVADEIHNYMFYPSAQGDKEIQLYKNALIKLQGFHSAYGEDAQVYSREEIVKQFKLFDNTVKDVVDKKLELLREVRELYSTDRKHYYKIKNLPYKSRVLRNNGKHSNESIVFVSSNFKTEFYRASNKGMEAIDFVDAAMNYLRAKPDEKPLLFDSITSDNHYKHVNEALEKYQKEFIVVNDNNTVKSEELSKIALTAKKFLRVIKQTLATDIQLCKNCDTLMSYIDEGIYEQLPNKLKELASNYRTAVGGKNKSAELDTSKISADGYNLQVKIERLLELYKTHTETERQEHLSISDPRIVISESFL